VSQIPAAAGEKLPPEKLPASSLRSVMLPLPAPPLVVPAEAAVKPKKTVYPSVELFVALIVNEVRVFVEALPTINDTSCEFAVIVPVEAL
jgi:hypothetical protein